MASSASAQPSNYGTVKLPTRSTDVVQNTERNPVWTLSSTKPDAGPASSASRPSNDPPLKAMCDMHSRPDAVCCRTLRGDDERNLLNPDFVRDAIIGLSDGLTVPFGLSAGLTVLGSTRTVVVGGIAELLSGAISMGVGGYLASKAERDHYRYLRTATRARVKRSCAGELEREVTEVLGPVGVDEGLCRRVAVGLMKVESQVANEDGRTDKATKSGEGFVQSILRSIARKPRTTLGDEGAQQLKFSEDVGLTPFLLKFGEGLEEVSNARLWASAITIGTCYAVGGLIPLLPYFFVDSVRTALYWSIGVTSLTLVIFGIFKTYYTGGKIGLVGYTQGAVSTLLIGAAAAGSAFAICAALEA